MGGPATELLTPMHRRPALARLANPNADSYITRDDILIVHYVSAREGSARLRARLLNAAGEVTVHDLAVTLTGDRAIHQETMELAEGYLLGLRLHTDSPGYRRGECWAAIGLARGQGDSAVMVQTLAQGLLYSSGNVYWPGGPNEGSVTPPGYLLEVAGSGVSGHTLPTNCRRRLISVWCAFTASAVAGTRTLVLIITSPGGGEIFRAYSQTGITAGVSSTFQWTPRASRTLELASNRNQVLDLDLWLAGGSTVDLDVDGLQAGDTFDDSFFHFEELLEP